MSEETPEYFYEGISSAGLLRAGRLLWPRWVELRGCVLREEVADPEGVDRWLAQPEGSVQQTEWVLNHVHLYDVVEEGWGEPEELFDERLMDVAERLAAAWRASLREAFPGRAFAVYVATPAEDHGPTVYALSDDGDDGDSG